MVHVTRDRKVHVAERTWKDMRRTTETQTKDLLQFREIIISLKTGRISGMSIGTSRSRDLRGG